LDLAAKENKTIITQDLDFSAILAETSTNKPSIITLRLNNAKPLPVLISIDKDDTVRYFSDTKERRPGLFNCIKGLKN